MMTEEDKAFLREMGRRITAARENVSPPYSARQLAIDLGYSHSWPLKVESGSMYNVSVIDVMRLAKYLAVSPNYLLGLGAAHDQKPPGTLHAFRRLFGDETVADALWGVYSAIATARHS